MNQDLPKWLQAAIVILVLMVALLVFFNHDRIHVYGTYLREKSPSIRTNFLNLSAEMNESQLKNHFEGVQLTCAHHSPEINSLGDRLCYSSIDKADGDAALTLAAFFRKGKLSSVIVQTPWWSHKTFITRLTTQFGQPVQAGLASRFGGPVWRWNVPNGYVEANRDRSINLLEWNLIMWTASKVSPGSSP